MRHCVLSLYKTLKPMLSTLSDFNPRNIFLSTKKVFVTRHVFIYNYLSKVVKKRGIGCHSRPGSTVEQAICCNPDSQINSTYLFKTFFVVCCHFSKF